MTTDDKTIQTIRSARHSTVRHLIERLPSSLSLSGSQSRYLEWMLERAYTQGFVRGIEECARISAEMGQHPPVATLAPGEGPTYLCRDCGRLVPDDEIVRSTLDAYAGPDDYDPSCPHCGSFEVQHMKKEVA